MGKSSGQKSTEKTTESSESKPPPFVSAAQQSMLGGIQETLDPYLKGDNYNKDMMRAYEMVRGEAENPTQVPFSPMSPLDLSGIGGVTKVNPAQMAVPFGMGAVAVNPAQLGAENYKQFMDPYERDVIQTSLANSREEQNRDLNAIRGRTAAASAFGGSGARGALQESQVTEDAGRRRDAMVAQLRSQGFAQATATALANKQMQQQAAMQNAANAMEAQRVNLGVTQGTLALNTANQQQADLANQQAALAAQEQAMKVNQFNAAGLDANAFQNVGLRQQALQQLLGIGNQQYGYPLQAAQIMAAAMPRDFGGTKTGTSTTTKETPSAQSPLQQILGVGLSLAGAPMTGGTSLIGGLGSLFK